MLEFAKLKPALKIKNFLLAVATLLIVFTTAGGSVFTAQAAVVGEGEVCGENNAGICVSWKWDNTYGLSFQYLKAEGKSCTQMPMLAGNSCGLGMRCCEAAGMGVAVAAPASPAVVAPAAQTPTPAAETPAPETPKEEKPAAASPSSGSPAAATTDKPAAVAPASVSNTSTKQEWICADSIAATNQDPFLPTTLIPADNNPNEAYSGLADKFRTGKFELYDLGTYVQYLVETLIYFAGGISVLFIVIGGYKYMIGGVSDDKEAGKKTIMYALTGLVVTGLAWTVVNAIQVFVTTGDEAATVATTAAEQWVCADPIK